MAAVVQTTTCFKPVTVLRAGALVTFRPLIRRAMLDQMVDVILAAEQLMQARIEREAAAASPDALNKARIEGDT